MPFTALDLVRPCVNLRSMLVLFVLLVIAFVIVSVCMLPLVFIFLSDFENGVPSDI